MSAHARTHAKSQQPKELVQSKMVVWLQQKHELIKQATFSKL